MKRDGGSSRPSTEKSYLQKAQPLLGLIPSEIIISLICLILGVKNGVSGELTRFHKR